MWEDIKMWLMVRYVRFRVYGPKSKVDVDFGNDILILENNKVFFNKKVLIDEVYQLKYRLFWIMSFFISERCRHRLLFIKFTGWKELEKFTDGVITSIFNTAIKKGFLETTSGIGVEKMIPGMVDYGYNQNNKIEKIVDDKFIRVSDDEGKRFISYTGGLNFLAKEYKEIKVFIWLLIAWLVEQIFHIWPFIKIIYNNIAPSLKLPTL